MSNIDIIQQMESTFNSLTSKEKEICLFVLKNVKRVQTMTITNLANATNSSIGSITRFCKKMKCKNYSDFKIKLTISYTEKHSSPDEEEDDDSIFVQVNRFYKQLIENDIQTIDEASIEKVARLISQARRIYIFGVGSSGFTSLELQSRLSRMGLLAFSCRDGDSIKIASTLLDQRDLIINISTSGNTTELIEGAKIARENHTMIVSFTSFANSPLYKLSDFSVLVYNSLFLNKEDFINSQFSIMYLIDMISVFLLRNKEYASNLKATIESIRNDKLNL